MMLLASCLNMQKAEKKIDSSPEESARYCSLRFPSKDSIVVKTDTVLTQAPVDHTGLIDSINRVIDSVNTEWDKSTDSTQGQLFQEITDREYQIISLEKLVKSLKAQYKPCADRLITKDSLIYRQDPSQSARIKYLEAVSATNGSTIARVTHTKNILLISTLSAFILLLLLLGYIIKKATSPKV